MKIPFVNLKLQYQKMKSEMDAVISEVISESAFIGGKYVKDFENKFAALYGVKHVISCANGTDSLYIIMKMLGIGFGDEVIVPANSWISSAESVTQTGAKVIFVDVHPDFYSMDEDVLLSKITTKTKAVMAVHLHGQMCDMDKIRKICDTKKINLIEDCAQSHFSEYHGIKAGMFGIAGSFSFYPGKNLGAYGDAGCIITNNDELARKCRMFANHGSLKKHEHEMEGINSRLDGLQAAVLNVKLNYIHEWTIGRINNACLYEKYLSGIREIVLPIIRPETVHTFHLYVIRAKRRNELIEFLREHGIETSIHYPRALPNLPAYAYLNNSETIFPIATRLQDEILSLPMYPELKQEEIEYISNKIISFYE